MAQEHVTRKVSYWRIVDTTNGMPFNDIDWRQLLFSHMTDSGIEAEEFHVQGSLLRGKVFSLTLSDVHQEALKYHFNKSIFDFPLKETMTLVLAKDKDFIPRQQETATGRQASLQSNGEGWVPVDNSFVWFLPFGNIFALLSESQSSARASRVGTWLEKYLKKHFPKRFSEISLTAHPVIDKYAGNKLAEAPLLRRIEVASIVGHNENTPSNFRRLFLNGISGFTAVRAEIKLSLVPGYSTLEDQQKLKEYQEEVFDDLEDHDSIVQKFKKAQVVIAADKEDDRPAELVDLISQQVTKSSRVYLETQNGVTTFSHDNALAAILDAFQIDKEKLDDLRIPDQTPNEN